MRYGHGTWVDAQGLRTAAAARFEAGTIVLSVPAKLVEDSAYPAVLDPVVSPEFGMDDPVYGPADGSQYSPAVAHNGTDLLVVWQDQRSENSDIYGTRVSNAGTVLDISGIRISTAVGYQESPSVAHDGTNFLVVWHDYRSGPDIYGRRVSGTGTVLDTSDILIPTATSFQYYPRVAHDGTNFLVVWQDYRSGTGFADIYGTRVGEDGMLLDSNGFPISTEPVMESQPRITSLGGEYSLVVYRSSDVSGVTNSERVLARILQPF